jgi:hypothetical protein
MHPDVKSSLGVYDRATGEHVDSIEVHARDHHTNFQAKIEWRSICSIKYGETMKEAIDNVIADFTRLPVLKDFEFRRGG